MYFPVGIKPALYKIDSPPDPLKLFEKFASHPYPFFLDSSTASARLGRFSFLGCEPFLVFKSKGPDVTLEWRGGKVENLRSDPFEALKAVFGRYRFSGDDGPIPFKAGGVGYLSYDLKNFVEELPDRTKDDLGLWDCVFGFYDVITVYDNLKNEAYIASSGLSEDNSGERPKKVREERAEYFMAIARGSSTAALGPMSVRRGSPLKSNFSRESYMDAVRRAKYYIRKGDIYQVNLSQRFETMLTSEPFDLYKRLRALSPAPFSAYFDFGDAAILSSSPERFLFKRGDYIETRPIKGTRPRGIDVSSDNLLERELVSCQKDRAEHVMIVDLERNDLGRICEYGSVRPSEFITLERYSTVFHLVSTVTGRLRPGTGPIDCLRAAFPGGSITGAPKIRAMEIIEELEPVKRSIYTGSIGYISFDGNMDTSIAIRTLIAKKGMAYFQVGGGIVADSDPESEYEETLDKARGLMRALGVREGSGAKMEAGTVR